MQPAYVDRWNASSASRGATVGDGDGEAAGADGAALAFPSPPAPPPPEQPANTTTAATTTAAVPHTRISLMRAGSPKPPPGGTHRPKSAII